MDKQVEIHAYHGWGMDDSFWDPIKSILPKQIVFKTANRGYFSKPFYPRFENDTKIRVVFTHSFGLHWCKTAVLSKADYLVIFNGFDSFYPSNSVGNITSKELLNLFTQQFQNNAEEALYNFRIQCFYPYNIPLNLPANFNAEKGLEDLYTMQSLQFPIIDLDFGSTIITMDSGLDKILGKPQGEAMINWYVGQKHSKIFKQAGHALPFTNPSNCWSYLSSRIPIFMQYENNI